MSLGSKHWFYTALFHLLVVALLGLLHRMMFLINTEFNYTYIKHAHSHVATLGWCSTALMIGLVNSFVTAEAKKSSLYRLFFWLFQITIAGMLIFFPQHGYAPITIIFSSLYLIVSYPFAYSLYKDIKQTAGSRNLSVAAKFAQASVLYLVLSSLGTWVLGPIMAKGLGGSVWYFSSIYTQYT